MTKMRKGTDIKGYINRAIEKFEEVFAGKQVEIDHTLSMVQYCSIESVIHAKIAYIQFFIDKDFQSEFIEPFKCQEFDGSEAGYRGIARFELNEDGVKFDGIEILPGKPKLAGSELWRFSANNSFLDYYTFDGSQYNRRNQSSYYYRWTSSENLENTIREMGLNQQEFSKLIQFANELKAAVVRPYYGVAYKGPGNYSMYVMNSTQIVFVGIPFPTQDIQLV